MKESGLCCDFTCSWWRAEIHDARSVFFVHCTSQGDGQDEAYYEDAHDSCHKCFLQYCSPAPPCWYPANTKMKKKPVKISLNNCKIESSVQQKKKKKLILYPLIQLLWTAPNSCTASQRPQNMDTRTEKIGELRAADIGAFNRYWLPLSEKTLLITPPTQKKKRISPTGDAFEDTAGKPGIELVKF